MTRFRAVSALLAATLAACGDASPPATPVAAAKIANPVTEASLTSVTLTADAEQRLGLEVAPIESRELPDTRQLSGVVVTPPGGTFALTAPVPGTILEPESGGIPAPGTTVRRDQPLLRLVPLPAGTDLVRGDEDLALAEVRARQADLETTRIEALARDSLVSRRELERAQGEREAARAVLQAARARADRLRTGASAGPGLSALTIAAPDGGVVVDLQVSGGQVVAAGTPLMSVAQMDQLWVQVAVYSGDLPRLAAQGRAVVAGDPPRGARRVTAPPTADALSASADVFYQLDRSAGLRPGQRVDISVPLTGAGQPRLAVPLGAIVYDQHGGSWVYARTGEHQYARRRVSIEGFADGWAILAQGPAVGTPVVTTGAAELLGTEFGAGK